MKKFYLFIVVMLTCSALPTFAQCFEGGPCGTTAYTGGSGGYIWRIPPAEQNPEEVRANTQSHVDAAGKAADIKRCLNNVAQTYTDKCMQRANTLKNSNHQACNNQAQYGGVIGFAGAAGIGLALTLSGPAGWIVGAVSFAGGAAGTWYSFGASNCRDSADQAYEYNKTVACPNYVKNAQDASCPK